MSPACGKIDAVRIFLVTCVVLLVAGCARGPKPMEADYHGAELTTNRQAAEKLNADRVARLLKARPVLHDLGSSREDECVGGWWFDEDQYYMPYECRTSRTTLVSFAGDFEGSAAKLVAALEATGCAKGLRESFTAQLRNLPTRSDLTQLEPTGGGVCEMPAPFRESQTSVRWFPVDPTEQQRERMLGQVEVQCPTKAHSAVKAKRYCEADQVNLDDVLQKVPAGDRWIAAVTFRTGYWQGEPITD